MRAATFTLDGEREYEGYTNGDKWNGFECPLFEMEEALNILNDVEGDVESGLNDKTKCFEVDGDIIAPRTIALNGKVLTLYGIGSFGWTWEEVTTREKR